MLNNTHVTFSQQEVCFLCPPARPPALLGSVSRALPSEIRLNLWLSELIVHSHTGICQGNSLETALKKGTGKFSIVDSELVLLFPFRLLAFVWNVLSCA